ncbi:MAG: hypothetical protein JXQ72_15485 [Anaerolineae bacterium]|nr:hypothetical protein [Anaerolineae bacterium]
MSEALSSPEHSRISILVGSLPVVTLGLLLVTLAVVFAPWPSDPPVYGQAVSHFERLRGKDIIPAILTDRETDHTAGWYGRRLLDGLVLALLVMGYANLFVIIRWRVWRALIALTLIGALGVAYSVSVGLYLGPMVMAGGFSLVLFGAGLSWASYTRLR